MLITFYWLLLRTLAAHSAAAGKLLLRKIKLRLNR
jgi:hypothetical protein